MKTLCTLLLLINIFAFVFSAAPNTGPPGQCTLGQNDDRTHAPSEYTPREYTYPPATSKPTSSQPQLKVMSWNIQSTFDFQCNLALAKQAAFVAQINPDFLGAQEVDVGVDIRCNCNIPQALGNALGHNAYFYQTLPFRNGKYGHNTVFGYAVQSTENIYYTVPFGKFEQRGAIAFLVSPPQLNGQKMWYINTHLEQSSVDARKVQVSQLINWVKSVLVAKQPNAVIVMTGDFYTVPGDGTYEPMAQYFMNAWAVFTGSTMGGYTHPANGPTLRFDHIWFKDPASGNIKTKVADFKNLETDLSDHLPILATLTFATGPGSATGSATTGPATTGSATTGKTTTTGSTSGPTQGPTPTPNPYSCTESQRGYYRCVSDTGFQQCDHSMWTATIQCPHNTICVPTGTTIYCGYPRN